MEMLNLLRKDFTAGAIFLLGVIIIIPFMSTIAMAAMIDDFGGINMSIFTLLIAGLCVGASFVFIAIDTSYKTDATYASLPVKRSTIIEARYISSIIITVSGFFLAVISCLSLIHIFKLSDPAFSIILDTRGIISMISFLLIILAFMLPFAFKFGPGKGAIAALVVQIGLILLAPLLGFIKNALSDIWNFDIMFFYRLLLQIQIWIAALPAIYAYLFIFSIVFMLIVISITLSVRFYNRRDL